MIAAADLATYLVADAASIHGRSVAELAAAAVEGGATVVQVRGKDLSAAELLEAVADCARRIAGRATLLVNDRVDVYLAARADGLPVDGVHVGQSDLPAERVRRLVGPDAVVGLSASRASELAALRRLPAGTVDYLGVGAIRATPTKKDHPDPLGWDGFAAFVALAAEFPCVAIGGVGPGDAAAARAAGAAGLAVVRAVCASPDPRAAAAALRREWEDAAPVAPAEGRVRS
ncbi:thiamine phosphate synthase [Microbacterium album]|uniref:Thiamine-phosphate synthase n=1 Tax=Microbacterium album TaxID=2053191 RepID=A0A917IJI1_9MICO|nr:thiamine phosphate synthase [Microbacterium album]GGH49760.1 thiamine-phosphate synthase [Microbacterium album]